MRFRWHSTGKPHCPRNVLRRRVNIVSGARHGDHCLGAKLIVEGIGGHERLELLGVGDFGHGHLSVQAITSLAMASA